MQHDNLGDDGYTNTLKGDRVAKDSCYCEVLGDLDSLQASLGKAKLYLPEEHNICIEKIQRNLWQLAGEISLGSTNQLIKQPITEESLVELDTWVMTLDKALTKFQIFTSPRSVELNEARVRARKFERSLTAYLREKWIRPVAYQYVNRLSKYLFLLAVTLEEVDNCEQRPGARQEFR